MHQRLLRFALVGIAMAGSLITTVGCRKHAAVEARGEPVAQAVAAAPPVNESQTAEDQQPTHRQSNKPAAGEAPFTHRTPAPPLDGGLGWLNTDRPIDLESLRGKFVVLDFWTYCCINCMHVLPELKKLEHAYPNNIVVIGVHSAKFETEQESDSIRQAILRHEIEHPVVNDAQMRIWNRYACQSWPSLRLIDPEGYLVAAHSGEIRFEALDEFFKQKLPYYRDHRLLDERPIRFALERDKAGRTPLRFPGKILADTAGDRLFIADSNHNRIVVASLGGKLQETIGGGAIGTADGDYRTAQFNHPQGMALVGETLYVADTENHLLRKVDLRQRRVTTIAGTCEQAPFGAVDRGSPKQTALNSPWALEVDGRNLYIAMAGAHQIWRMPLDESEIGSFAGNGREDIVDGPLSPSEPFRFGSSSFAQPSGLDSDGAWLYVADSEGSSVRAVSLAKDEVVTIVGTADLPSGRLFTFGDVDGRPDRARLQHCLDVVHHDGRLYVADTYNHKIKVIDLRTRELKTLAGTGKSGSNDGPAMTATFFEPAGLTYTGGKLYVADTNNHKIRVIDLARGNRVSTLKIEGLAAL